MEKFNRAVRLHHVKRLKKTRASYWGYHRGTKSLDKLYAREEYVGVRGFTEMDAKESSRVVQNPQCCSGPCCGNARRYYGLSKGEIRFNVWADEQMSEV